MDIKQQEITTSTTISVTVEELTALAAARQGGLADLFQRALNNGSRPHELSPEAKIVVQEAPMPARRLPQNAGGKPTVQCHKCKTMLVWYKLDNHVGNASCVAREKRNKAAERRLHKAQQLIGTSKE